MLILFLPIILIPLIVYVLAIVVPGHSEHIRKPMLTAILVIIVVMLTLAHQAYSGYQTYADVVSANGTEIVNTDAANAESPTNKGENR